MTLPVADLRRIRAVTKGYADSLASSFLARRSEIQGVLGAALLVSFGDGHASFLPGLCDPPEPPPPFSGRGFRSNQLSSLRSTCLAGGGR